MRDYTHDLKAMAAAVADDTAVIYLANPNNPTGTYNRKGEFESFLEKIPADVLIVLDEAYFEYVDCADYPHGRDYYPDHPNLILLRTFSKIYGLSALRLGWAYAPPHVVDVLHRVREPFKIGRASCRERV